MVEGAFELGERPRRYTFNVAHVWKPHKRTGKPDTASKSASRHLHRAAMRGLVWFCSVFQKEQA